MVAINARFWLGMLVGGRLLAFGQFGGELAATVEFGTVEDGGDVGDRAAFLDGLWGVQPAPFDSLSTSLRTFGP